MLKLNKDILFLIFEELYNDYNDSKSLSSCLSINRLWCETVIPILWRNPWRCGISLDYIITFYLPYDIKEFLTRQKIKLPSVSPQLLFDYLSFCKTINTRGINKYVHKHTYKYPTSSIGIESSQDYNRFLLQKEVYSLFMKKCPKLNYLDMTCLEHQIFYFPEARARLNSLCVLICGTYIDSTYFYGLAYLCNSIETLILDNSNLDNANLEVNHGIIKLIEVQRNLKHFEWNEDGSDGFEEHGDIYEEIFLALVKKAHNLTHFIISFAEDCEYEIPLAVLELRNLQVLTLNFLLNYSYAEQPELFTSSAYPNLEVLQLGEDVCIYMVTCIIQNSGGHLRKILIVKYETDEDNYNFDVQSLDLIRTIYEKCPLVETLSIAFPLSKEHFVEFEKLLKVCQKLRTLLLDIKYIYDLDEYVEDLYRKEFLKVLNQSPINLREIRFFDYFKFSLQNLEKFLENWRGRPALTIIIIQTASARDYANEEYMKIINRYKNDVVLKDFRYIYRSYERSIYL